MKQYRILALAASFIALAVLAPQPAPADLGLDVSPAKLELTMTPGTSYNIPITIHNGAGSDTHVQAMLVDFGVANNGDYQIQRVGTQRYSLMKWATINPREFDLASGNTQQVRLSLALPQSGLTGEYAGIAFFQTRPTRRAGAVALSVRVASKFYLTIPNTVKIDGAITKMTASGGSAGEIYRVLFKNLGNAHVYLRGQVLVKKGDQTVAQLPMPDEMLVERGGERLIEVPGKELPAGKYLVIAMIDYGGKTQTGGEIVYNKK
jgi:hypothetical protein